jgi:hypothetical protein
MNAVDLEGNWQEKILTAENAAIAEKTFQSRSTMIYEGLAFLIREYPRESVARSYLPATFTGR